MGSLFGKPAKSSASAGAGGSKSGSKKNAITDKDRAILDLKIARDKLTKYQKRVNIESEKLLKQAQTLLNSGHKVRADFDLYDLSSFLSFIIGSSSTNNENTKT
jgi:hypothetical protein